MFLYFNMVYFLLQKKRRRKDHQSNSFEENDESIKQLADHYEQKYVGSLKFKHKCTNYFNLYCILFDWVVCVFVIFLDTILLYLIHKLSRLNFFFFCSI